MSTYTEFEAQFLVAAYLVTEDTGKAIVNVSEILERFRLERKPNWIMRAISSFGDSGYTKGSMHMGAEEDQHVYLNAYGIKEAERLLEDEIITNAMLSERDAGVPASDRYVSLSDNEPQAVVVKSALAELFGHLESANDFGSLNQDEVEEAKREVWLLEQEFSRAIVRVDWIEPLAKACLKWIAIKAAEQIVGALAIAALTAIAILIGFSV